MGRGTGGALIVGVGGVTGGCGAEAPVVRTCLDVAAPVEVPALRFRHRTAGLEISSDRAVCAGTLVAWQAHFERVAAAIDVEPREVSLFVMHDPEEVARWCGPGLGSEGCTLASGVMFSQAGSVEHELAHAAACQVNGATAGFLAEGFATAFDGRVLRLDPRPQELVEGSADVYDAGHFVHWIHRTYGAERLRDWYAAVDREDGADELRSSFQAVYGGSFAGIESRYLHSAPEVTLQASRCAHPGFTANEVGFAAEVTLRCEDEGTFGPHPDDADAAFAVRVLEIPVDGTYEVVVAGTERGFRIEACEPDNMLSPARITAFSRPAVLLRAGRYRVEMLGEHGATVGVWFGLTAGP